MAIISGLFFEADGPALACGVSDLDRARIALGFGDEEFRDFGSRASGFEIDGFHHGLRAFAFVGLSEAGYGPAEWGNRTRIVVAVMATESRRRYEECASTSDVLVQGAHRGVQRLHSHAKSVVPGCGVELAKIAFVVER